MFRLAIYVSYTAYRIEGVNALLLILPAKMIVPTLRRYGAHIGEGTVIHSPLVIHNAGQDYSHLHIGEHVYFGRSIFIDLADQIYIDDRVTISMRCTLLTHTDPGESRVKNLPRSSGPLRIKSDAYLGAEVTILENVTVGEGAVVGAKSLVTRNVEAGTISAGVPAKEIRKLNV